MKHKGTCDTFCGHRLTVGHCTYTDDARYALDKDPRIVTYYLLSENNPKDLSIEFVFAMDRKVNKIYHERAKKYGITDLSK